MWRAKQFHPFGFISASPRSARGLVGSVCLKIYYIFSQFRWASILMVNSHKPSVPRVGRQQRQLCTYRHSYRLRRLRLRCLRQRRGLFGGQCFHASNKSTPRGARRDAPHLVGGARRQRSRATSAFPRKRTSADKIGMSAKGQKRQSSLRVHGCVGFFEKAYGSISLRTLLGK